MQGFVKSYFNQRQDVAHSQKIMYYFKQSDLPVLTTLALEFAVFNNGNTPNVNYNRQMVRISGWLMLDPEHQDMINSGLRSTLWEIHPITKIEVWDNGSWVDLDTP